MNKQQATQIIRQIVESVSLSYKDHMLAQEALKALSLPEPPKIPEVKNKVKES